MSLDLRSGKSMILRSQTKKVAPASGLVPFRPGRIDRRGLSRYRVLVGRIDLKEGSGRNRNRVRRVRKLLRRRNARELMASVRKREKKRRRSIPI